MTKPADPVLIVPDMISSSSEEDTLRDWRPPQKKGLSEIKLNMLNESVESRPSQYLDIIKSEAENRASQRALIASHQASKVRAKG